MATDQSLDMSTSLGAFALQNATASLDAHIVAKARQAGMIILYKVTLRYVTYLTGRHRSKTDWNIGVKWLQMNQVNP